MTDDEGAEQLYREIINRLYIEALERMADSMRKLSDAIKQKSNQRAVYAAYFAQQRSNN